MGEPARQGKRRMAAGELAEEYGSVPGTSEIKTALMTEHEGPIILTTPTN